MLRSGQVQWLGDRSWRRSVVRIPLRVLQEILEYLLPENNLGIVWTAKADIELRNFVSDNLSSVLDRRGDGEEHIVQSLVTTWCHFAAGWQVWLWAAVVSTCWEGVVDAVLWIAA